MKPSYPHACPICGHPLLPGDGACPIHGLPAAPLESTQGEQTPTEEENTLVNQQLDEYQVRRCIGRGGMGVVYEAEHVTLGRKVALKFLRQEYARSPYARPLLREARTTSSIQHRGIVDVFGFGQHPNFGPYLVMEYLEGQPLHDLIAKRAPLAPALVIQWLIEVLDALWAAHSLGVIHRDLKPSNIFLVRDLDGTESVKVLDFGLAKRSTAPDGMASNSEIIVGTPHYMAPEQALNEAVGPQTDLYAVGVIAFEMLTRRRPFPGRSNLELVAHHLKSPPPPPSFYVELPARLDELVLRLLAKDPQQRPASAQQAASELRRLLQEGGSSRRVGPPLPLFQERRTPGKGCTLGAGALPAHVCARPAAAAKRAAPAAAAARTPRPSSAAPGSSAPGARIGSG
jgi:serine/threonine protein kinase